MKKILLSFLFLLLSIIGYSQAERYPVFPACESEQISNLPSCFKNQVKEVVLNNFIIPENVIQENFKDPNTNFEGTSISVYNPTTKV
mgnify:CR=1 FL=1